MMRAGSLVFARLERGSNMVWWLVLILLPLLTDDYYLVLRSKIAVTT